MAMSPQAASSHASPDHGFHELRVREVIRETDDACSYILEPPFPYDAGQFVTFRLHIAGETHLRCYSMSSAPAVDDDFKVTVKRVPAGVVSNWMIDTLRAGDPVEVNRPAGVFTLPAGTGPVVAFGAGSGITPVISIMKSALAQTSRPVRLLYANRDRASIIFATELDGLARDHGARLTVAHHLDVEHGFVTADDVRPHLVPDAEYFICGPAPFMDLVEATLLEAGVEPARIHIERFTPTEPATVAPASGEPVAEAAATSVTIELAGKTATTDHHPGTTVLQTARQAGLSPPFSCESGSCATCMARLTEGEVTMYVNNALTDDEVAEGWILTCQSVPTTPTVHVVYEDA